MRQSIESRIIDFFTTAPSDSAVSVYYIASGIIKKRIKELTPVAAKRSYKKREHKTETVTTGG